MAFAIRGVLVERIRAVPLQALDGGLFLCDWNGRIVEQLRKAMLKTPKRRTVYRRRHKKTSNTKGVYLMWVEMEITFRLSDLRAEIEARPGPR